MAICKGCGAYIKWMTTVSGKATPVDPEEIYYQADPDGDLIIVNTWGETQRARKVPYEERDGIGNIPHWATCPAADRFRRSRYKSGD